MLLARMGEPSTPDELFRFPTLHQDPEGPSVWRLATARGDTGTVAIEPVLATGSLDILIASACQGTGIVVAGDELQESPALSSAMQPDDRSRWILHLVFASRRGMLPGVRAVIDFVAATLKSSAAP